MNRTSNRDNFAIIHKEEIEALKQQIIESGADYFQSKAGEVYINLDQACREVVEASYLSHKYKSGDCSVEANMCESCDMKSFSLWLNEKE